MMSSTSATELLEMPVTEVLELREALVSVMDEIGRLRKDGGDGDGK